MFHIGMILVKINLFHTHLRLANTGPHDRWQGVRRSRKNKSIWARARSLGQKPPNE